MDICCHLYMSVFWCQGTKIDVTDSQSYQTTGRIRDCDLEAPNSGLNISADKMALG